MADGDMADYYDDDFQWRGGYEVFDEDEIRVMRVRQGRRYTEHPLSNPRKVNEFLGQSKFWVNAQLEKIRIKDMDSSYLQATMMFLLERAPKLFFEMDLRDQTRGVPVSFTDDPRARMMATAIFTRMMDRYRTINEKGYKVAVRTVDIQD